MAAPHVSAVADMSLLEFDVTRLHVDPGLFILVRIWQEVKGQVMEIPGEPFVDVIFEATDPLTTCLDGRVEPNDEQNTSIVRVISGPPGALVGTGGFRYDKCEATTRRKNDHGVARMASHV